MEGYRWSTQCVHLNTRDAGIEMREVRSGTPLYSALISMH